jgi:hypothetical protein
MYPGQYLDVKRFFSCMSESFLMYPLIACIPDQLAVRRSYRPADYSSPCPTSVFPAIFWWGHTCGLASDRHAY